MELECQRETDTVQFTHMCNPGDKTNEQRVKIREMSQKWTLNYHEHPDGRQRGGRAGGGSEGWEESAHSGPGPSIGAEPLSCPA